MGKALAIFLILCAVVGGTVWLNNYRSETSFLANAATWITTFLENTRDTFFLKQPPPPDPEALIRFNNAVDRELEQLKATQQFAGEKVDESHHAPEVHVPHPPAPEPHTNKPETSPQDL